MVRAFQRNPGLSIRDAVKNVHMSPGYVHKIRIEKGLQSYKVSLVPNKSDKQNTTAEYRSQKLYDNIVHNFDCIIMDDETYVKADFKQIPGQVCYTAKKKAMLHQNLKKKSGQVCKKIFCLASNLQMRSEKQCFCL